MRIIVVLLCWLMAGIVGVYWMQSSGWLGLPQGLAWLVWLAGCLMAIRELHGSRDGGILHWDGQQWRWDTSAGSLSGMALPRLDFQHWLLLEFRSQERKTIWLWPQREASPLYWAALRRALFARRPPDGALDGQTTAKGSGQP